MATVSLDLERLAAALPDVTSDRRLAGLDGPVRVFRDRYGIPHVRARSALDAFFGQGFVTAQDRLWHMDHDRLRAYGRWAEMAGPSALDQDKMMRRFQIGASVKGDYDAVNAETRQMLDAYVGGVNAFIDTSVSLPIEYDLVGCRPARWEPWDCLAVFKVRHIMMGVFEGKLWRARLANALGAKKAAELIRGYQPGHLMIVPPGVDYRGAALNGLAELEAGLESIAWLRDDPEAGSNSWVLAGSRTASGKPLLAGDPHRGLDTPNVYYQNHIECPEFDVIGLSFPGCPGFPHFGHNANVAWCVTHAGADYQDLFLERFRVDGEVRYEFRGDWLPAEVRREIIEVRGEDAVEMDVAVTRHGPIIAGDPAKGNAVSFSYTATAEPNLGFESLTRMMRATSADELDESMRTWVDPCNNFLFADAEGNIGYLNRGRVPIRAMANAWLPVPGWTSEHEWQGSIPFEELTRSRNPETGYIVTANNRIVGDDYPYYIALDFAPEHRARRIKELLDRIDAATVEDMGSVHAERVSMPARVYVELLKNVETADEVTARARGELAAWDGSMERDSVAPTIYSAFRARLHEAILSHHLGPLADEVSIATGRGAPSYLRQLASLLVTMAGRGDASLLPPGSSWSSTVATALAEGVSDLRERLGDDVDAWQWGKVHYTRPRHTLSASFPELASVLNPPSVPMGGDGDTPQAGSYSPADPFVMTSMSVARYVFDTADWDNSAWISPLGASGHPGSPHYSDQTAIWAEVDLVPMLYGWDRIDSEAETRQTLRPT